MKKEISYKELQKFDAVSGAYLAKNGFIDANGWTSKASTKLVSNIKNVLKQGNVHFEELNSEIKVINRNNALTDEKTKAILREEVVVTDKDGGSQKTNGGNYKMSIEGEANAEKQIKELKNSLVDIHIRITPSEDIPELTEEELEVFNGIVIPETTVTTEGD